MAAPGWYRDPSGQNEGRYWDGQSWTTMTSRAGQTFDTPVDPARATVPPVPGSELAPAAPAPRTPPPSINVSTSQTRSPVGAIVAGIVAIVVVILLFVLVRGDDSDDEETPETSVPAETTAPAETPAPEGGSDETE